MKDRVFHLLERHQKLDDRLRRAQARRDTDPRATNPLEIARLWILKSALKGRLARLLRSAAVAR